MTGHVPCEVLQTQMKVCQVRRLVCNVRFGLGYVVCAGVAPEFAAMKQKYEVNPSTFLIYSIGGWYSENRA